MENENEREEFRPFCVRQVQRLGIFEKFQFVNLEAQKEYRRWLEGRCQTKPRAEAIMDAAVELDTMPTIADLNRIFIQLFPEAISTAPELTAEECRQRDAFMREWREQEEFQAAERRRAHAERFTNPPKRLTEAELIEMLRRAG